MVCVTYIQQIYFFQHSFSYFILNKNEIRVKPGHLQQIKKKYGSVIFCKASFIFNWKHFNTLWVFFLFFICTKTKLFISHSWFQGETWEQKLVCLVTKKEEDVHLPKINSFVSLLILTIIKAKVQNTELYITIIPSFQEPGFIFVRVVSL